MHSEPVSLDPQHRRPLWLAALATSLVVPLAYLCASALFERDPGETVADQLDETGPVALFAALPISAFAMYALALPLIIRWRTQGDLSFLRACAACVGAGIVAITLFCLLLQVLPSLILLAFGAGVGLGAGLVFSLVGGVRLRNETVDG